MTPNFLLYDFVNIDAQKIGCLYSPRELSHSKICPGLSYLSAPTTSATLANPDAM